MAMAKGTKTWNQIWTPQRWQRAQDLRAKGFGDASIANDLGLTKIQVAHKFGNEAHRRRELGEKKKLHDVLNARDALFASPRTIIQQLCGDPLPGRSALDKQRMNLSEPPLLDPDSKAGLSP